MSEIDPRILVQYDALIATRPEIARKGKSNPYTSLNGHMFSFITKEGFIALRLPDDAIEAFRKKYRTGPVIQYGAVMRGYVLVPKKLSARTAELAPYFERSIAYIASLKPKPTTRPKKKAAKKKATKKKAKKKAPKKKRS